MICDNCKRKEETVNGFCPKRLAPDGLPFRCVGPWSQEKANVIDRYVNIVARAMNKKWNLVYVDLFSGPGKCCNFQTSKIFDSSPVKATEHHLIFNQYFFVDKDKETISILKNRLSGVKQAEFICGDCNENIDYILSKIKPHSLCIFVIDPTGLQFKFESLQKILVSKNLNKDIIELFPYGLAINRGLNIWRKLKSSPKLDNFLGVNDSINKLPKFRSQKLFSSITRMYKDSILKANPKFDKSISTKTFRNSNNVPMYHLYYLTTSPVGVKFFKEAQKVGKGQLSLGF